MVPAAVAQAQTATETVIYSFLEYPNGGNPYAPLTRDAEGNLYGTTNQGGQANAGVVFKLDATGAYSILHSFRGGSDGANPYSGVLHSSTGALYGTTYQGGASNAGTVYEIGSSGHAKILYSFTGGADGGNPYAGIIADSSGNLYGTTYRGGAANLGVVYTLARSGLETVLHSFAGVPDGANPYAGVISDSSGNLYGTTVNGGAAGVYTYGTVYKLNIATRQETVLYSFDTENFGHGPGPGGPYGGVIRDPGGNLYGVASAGGTYDGGAIYEINAAGTYSVLYSFTNLQPNQPQGSLIRDAAGNLYGTTEAAGTSGAWGAVYELETTGTLKTLYIFPGAGARTDRGAFNAGLIADPAGNLYGTTPYGGMVGMVYRINTSGQGSTLYNFATAPGGTTPFAGVALDSTGNLYGGTQYGGSADWGVVFKASITGGEKPLLTFTGGADGLSPESTPVLDGKGNVYGTASGGSQGYGEVYKIGSSGQRTILHTFTDGADGLYPAGLTSDAKGNLYGAAGGGGLGGGVVFKITPSDQFTVLYSFTGGADGAGPGNVILDKTGNIYGTTYGGGSAGVGVVYKLSTSGQQTVLHSFAGGPDGALGGANLFRDSAGDLYGTTSEGGGAVAEAGYGVVFKLDADGMYTVLYSFTGGADGGNPFSGVIGDSAGNLYGTTAYGGNRNCTGTGCGVVYEISPSGDETVLYAFTGGADGDCPYASLAMDTAGNLYGTTPWGGKGGMPGVTFSGGGVVFKITIQ